MSDSNGKNGRPWGPIREIDADMIPPARTVGKWFELYADLNMRLEQTSRAFALVIPFPSLKEAQNARTAMRKYFTERMGQGSIELSARKQDDGSGALYVRRGEAWKK